MVKLKKIAVYAACGLMLATAGNGFGSLNVSAEESKDVYSEKGIGDVEEQDSLYGYRSYKDGVKNIKKETHIAYYSDGTSEVTRVYEYDTNGILTSGMEKDPVNETLVPEFTNGLISCEKIYDEEGNLLRYYNYEYDSLQRKIKCTRYAADGRLLGSNTTEYYGDSYNWYRITDYYSDDSYEISEFSNDSLNLCTATYNYESDGTLYSYSLNEHDANGNETKSTRYDAEGNVKWYYVNTYDERNMITSFLSYDEDGTLEYYDTYSYDFDADGDITREIQESSSGNTFVTVYEYYDSSVAQVVTDSIVTQGIYCSQTSPSIVAGLVVDNKASISGDIEYQWLVCEESTEAWTVASDWTVNNEWINYTPSVSGNYIFVCNARIVGNPDSLVQKSFGTPFTKQGGIKQICQMPYEDGGYLIGFESYDNPNQEYQYEMFVMDLTLLAEGSATPWVHATGKIQLPAGSTPEEGKTMWTVWQPKYGYYLTLFRLYDKDGIIIDEVPYGFANAY